MEKYLSDLVSRHCRLHAGVGFIRNADETIIFKDDESDDTEYFVYLIKPGPTEELTYRHGIRIMKYDHPQITIRHVQESIDEFVEMINVMAR